jgi:hypothetical protein
MQKPLKDFYDNQGNLIIRPYRLKDLSAIYGVSDRTVRRWIDEKAAEYGKKTKKYFTIEQVIGIVNAIGLPQKIATVVKLSYEKQAA